MRNFKTFNLAVEFYHLTRTMKLPRHLRDQLLRAASSVALNLAEGRGKRTLKDQAHFFQIAFGSIRECQAILILAEVQEYEVSARLDHLAASAYQLIKNSRA